MRLAPLLAALALVAGCDASGAEGASLSTDHRAYAPEALARLQLANDTGGQIHYPDLDCAGLQVRTEAGWADTETGTARGCRDVLYALAGGAAEVGEVVLDVAPGTYRFRTVVYLDGVEAVPLATAPFDVDAALGGAP